MGTFEAANNLALAAWFPGAEERTWLPLLCAAKPLSNSSHIKDVGLILTQRSLVLTILIESAAATPASDILHDMS